MSKYKTLIFDLDDTLIDNRENVRYAFLRMCEFLEKDYSDAKFEEWLKFDHQFWIDFYDGKLEIPYDKGDERFVPYVQSLRYFNFFKGEIDIEQALEVNLIFLDSLKEKVYPVDGAREVLEYLSSNYRLVIATNGPRQAVKAKLENIGVFEFISDVFSADLTKNVVTKPSKEYFIELLEYLNVEDSESVLVIGDSLRNDISGAAKVSVDSCWFDRGEEELTDDYSPTYTIKSLKELKKIL